MILISSWPLKKWIGLMLLAMISGTHLVQVGPTAEPAHPNPPRVAFIPFSKEIASDSGWQIYCWLIGWLDLDPRWISECLAYDNLWSICTQAETDWKTEALWHEKKEWNRWSFSKQSSRKHMYNKQLSMNDYDTSSFIWQIQCVVSLGITQNSKSAWF